MKKRRNYLLVLAVALIIFGIGILFNVREIRDFYVAILAHMTAPDVLITASLIGFIFVEHKHYWKIVFVSAVIVSIFVQLIMVGNGFDAYMITTRFFGFFGIVYVLNFAKIMIGK